MKTKKINMSFVVTSGVIKLAIKEAEESSYNYRIGAVVFKGSRILSSGHNSVRMNKINPKYKNHMEALHAEQAALLNLDWTKLKGSSILVIRLNNQNELLLAKPCPMCQKLINHIGIKNIYYSNRCGEIIKFSN